jgi:hypothetical protein
MLKILTDCMMKINYLIRNDLNVPASTFNLSIVVHQRKCHKWNNQNTNDLKHIKQCIY